MEPVAPPSAPSPARRISRRDVLRGASAGLVVVTVPGWLAACGGQDQDAAEPSATAEGAAVAGTIAFFGWDVADTSAGLGKGFQAVKLAFERANDGATVRFDGVPFGDFVAAGSTRARAGKLGDTVEMLPGVNHATLFPALKASTKEDWGPLADELDGWEAGVIDPAQPEQVAGVPLGAQGNVWYYNKALFERAGLDPEAPPKTWDEFTRAASKLKAKGIAPIGMSGVDSNLAWWAWSSLTPQFFPSNEEVQQVRSGEVPLDDPRFLQSLEPIEETFRQGWWNDDFRDRKFADVEGQFAAGKVAMVPGLITSAMNWQVWDAKLGADAYGVFTAPEVEGGQGQKQFYNPTLIIGVSKTTKNEATARAWTSFLASKEGQEILLRESGTFPNRDDIDVGEVSGSSGAQAIKDIVADVGGVDVVQNQFTAAAQGAALQKLTSAIVDGDLRGFLADLEQQQRQG
jgi:multiple sugar transport system substrate-binding protein